MTTWVSWSAVPVDVLFLFVGWTRFVCAFPWSGGYAPSMTSPNPNTTTVRPRRGRSASSDAPAQLRAGGSQASAQTPVPAAAVVLWQPLPQEHDYPAAASYLSMLAGIKSVRAVVKALKKAPLVHLKAKDILRAPDLPLLPRDNVHVAADLAAVKGGRLLSPCLMVRGELRTGQSAQIADGYHRVCASYWTDEDTDIPVKIVKR